jgi:anhydro-N-acetylmuramic acid kinase
VLALVSGVPVVWDFRTADVRLGGQGAPLAPFYHFALAQHVKAEAPLAFLNLGGVGNLTWVDPRKARPEEEGAILAFDTGPANAPLDDLCHARLGIARDEGGALAARGRVAPEIVAAFLQEPFFFRMPPKSLDRSFGDMAARISHLGEADALATLTECAAAAIAEGLGFCPIPPERVLVCGGGRHNAHLMQAIAAHLPCPVVAVESVGLDGDMIEAQAFAFLAMRVARGLPTSCPATTGVAAAVGGGQLSAP